MVRPVVVALMGPTGSGKARLAVEAAAGAGALLVSCDSMKVYRGMDVGTAKPGPEARSAWRGLDLVDPWETYNAHMFKDLFEDVLARARQEGRPILVSGGTMLYLKAATEGLGPVPPRDAAVRERLEAEADAGGLGDLHARLSRVDPAAAARIHPNDRRRLVRALEVHQLTGHPLSSFHGGFGRVREDIERRVLVVTRERADMDARIDARVDRMLEAGWVDECRRLAADPRGMSREARQALGYRELLAWLEAGEAEPLADVAERIRTATRRFARRQLTWLRRVKARALEVGPEDDVLRHADALRRALGRT